MHPWYVIQEYVNNVHSCEKRWTRRQASNRSTRRRQWFSVANNTCRDISENYDIKILEHRKQSLQNVSERDLFVKFSCTLSLSLVSIWIYISELQSYCTVIFLDITVLCFYSLSIVASKWSMIIFFMVTTLGTRILFMWPSIQHVSSSDHCKRDNSYVSFLIGFWKLLLVIKRMSINIFLKKRVFAHICAFENKWGFSCFQNNIFGNVFTR